MSAPTRPEDLPLLRALNAGEYDFVDFGCSHGGSVEFAQQKFEGGAGLGMDIDPDKVMAAREAGRDAMVVDLTQFAARADTARFVLMSHLLEHLSGLKAAEQVMTCGVRIARDFVFVQQPWFDSDGYLFGRGLKLFWSDWHGHPTRMTTLDFHYILKPLADRGEIRDFSVYGSSPIRTSRHSAVHALGSPRNQKSHDPSAHPAKPDFPVLFRQPVFHEIHVVIDIDGRKGLDAYEASGLGGKRLYRYGKDG
ncbi:MAG: class I SAM-dependent methyltransferase [Litorimonas sp.]